MFLELVELLFCPICESFGLLLLLPPPPLLELLLFKLLVLKLLDAWLEDVSELVGDDEEPSVCEGDCDCDVVIEDAVDPDEVSVDEAIFKSLE